MSNANATLVNAVPMRWFRSRAFTVATWVAVALAQARAASASSIIVPDQTPTIQAAIEAAVDTVFLRPGEYFETPVARQPITLMATPGEPGAKAVLAGLRLHINRPAIFPALYECVGLAIVGPVIIANDRGLCDIAFINCSILGGVTDSSLVVDTGNITFIGSRLDQVASLRARGLIRLDSCYVSGQVVACGDPLLEVTRCTFEGSGFGYGITSCVRINSAWLTDNIIRSYSIGIRLFVDDTDIMANTVTDCAWAGIAVDAWGSASLEDNVVERCGTGVIVEAIGAGVMGNRVLGARYHGIDLSGEFHNVAANLVWRCGGDGIRLRGTSDYGETKVRSNTSCGNGGSGFVWEELSYRPEVNEWVNNIGWGNQLFGMKWIAADSGAVWCNDWFGNQLGGVEGRPSSTDYFVDPVFCNADSGDFRLSAASPLWDSVCGPIGAFGVGCGSTATVVQRFSAGRGSDGIRVIWAIAEGATASEIWLERSEAEGGAWMRPLTERWFENEAVVELDRTADLDRTYWYRVVALEGSETLVIGAPIVVRAEPRHAFRLIEVGPSPGVGPLKITFALKHAATIAIDVYDLQGRRVASPGRGSWPAGAHTLEWSGRTDGGDAAPAGLYFLRYQYPGGQDRRAIIRTR